MMESSICWGRRSEMVLVVGFRFGRAACRTCVTNASASLWCCIEDGSRPPEVGLQELASNHPVLLRTKGVVVSD